MRHLIFALVLMLAGPAAADVVVTDAYARVARPGAPTGAIFMVLHNAGDRPDRLIAADSPVAEIVQLHTHIHQDGIVRMRRMEGGIPLEPGAKHELARGGDHVMLMGLNRHLADGERITLTLTFEITGDVTVEVPIDNARGQASKP